MKEKHLGFSGFENHLQKFHQKRSKIKKTLVVGLLLTAMVDMFSLLVVFLLQSYSATGELFYMNKHIELPSAQNAQPVDPGLLIAISEKEVSLDEESLGTLADVLKKPVELVRRVRKLVTEERRINLQADRNLPSTQVSYVMGLLQQAGYQDFRITVSPGGFGEAPPSEVQ